MKTVNVAELKNKLSWYLRRVKAGQEILVKDREFPVAVIIPWNAGSNEELLTLANQGLIRLGHGQIDDDFWDISVPQVSKEAIRRAIEAEREDSW